MPYLLFRDLTKLKNEKKKNVLIVVGYLYLLNLESLERGRKEKRKRGIIICLLRSF